ncbi:integrase core domain-containing protein, partial [Ralstonia solanacearum]|uniref:integrase core domain-containing protein n=1 Tax=Ralstonia solanacearum TaxID=305 RepID=UPI00399D75EC
MRHARQLIEEWRIEYNTERPHSSLGYMTPVQFAQGHGACQKFRVQGITCSQGDAMPRKPKAKPVDLPAIPAEL